MERLERRTTFVKHVAESSTTRDDVSLGDERKAVPACHSNPVVLALSGRHDERVSDVIDCNDGSPEIAGSIYHSLGLLTSCGHFVLYLSMSLPKVRLVQRPVQLAHTHLDIGTIAADNQSACLEDTLLRAQTPFPHDYRKRSALWQTLHPEYPPLHMKII